jgi:hypothetical protein
MNVIHYILFILFFLIMYSISFKNIEGFDDEFYYYDKLIDYKTIPNSFVNDSTPSRTVNKFGFYKGKGTFKKGYTKETKSDEKISTLNKLLNRLLGNIVSDNQDCVGSFGKYSECDKSCGSNAFQTRKYNITQERGKNGKDCPFIDGYEEKLRCNLDECQLGDICENNADCETGNCNPDSTRCENMVPCDSENVHVCNETQCINLNDNGDNNNDKMIEGSYIYNNVDKECFFKTPAEIEELNLNVFTYDYRTLSNKVKNLALDCEYYQIKKDGIGPCVNASNIVMEEDEPICLPGYGPEPTLFNASHACSECIISSSEKSDDGCYCENGGDFVNATGVCGDVTKIESTPSTLCKVDDDNAGENYYLKIKDGITGCQFCQRGQSFKKVNGEGVCTDCPGGEITIREFCQRTCNDNNQGLTERCDELCHVDTNGSYVISFDKVKKYLYYDNNSQEGVGSIGKLPTSYYEQCISGLVSVESGQQQYCTGTNQDKREKIGGICINNCVDGSYWDNNQCIRCEPLPVNICSVSDSTRCRSAPSNLSGSDTDADTPIPHGVNASEVQYCVSANRTNKYYISGDGVVDYCSQSFDDNGNCSDCPRGSHVVGGQCYTCPVGTFGSQSNLNGSCTPCPAGQYQSASGSTECQRCPAGTFASASGSVSCTPCSAGTYNIVVGSDKCINCPPGTYQDEAGQPGCKKKTNCWEMTTSAGSQPHRGSPQSQYYPTVFTSLGDNTSNSECGFFSDSSTFIDSDSRPRYCGDYDDSRVYSASFQTRWRWTDPATRYFRVTARGKPCSNNLDSYIYYDSSPGVMQSKNLYCSNRYYIGANTGTPEAPINSGNIVSSENITSAKNPVQKITEDKTEVYNMMVSSSTKSAHTDSDKHCLYTSQCVRDTNKNCISGRSIVYNDRKDLNIELRSITSPYQSGYGMSTLTCREYFGNIYSELRMAGGEHTVGPSYGKLLENSGFNSDNCNLHSLPENDPRYDIAPSQLWDGTYGDEDYST